VIDAMNSRGEDFDEERIINCLASLPSEADAKVICTHLCETIAEWAEGVQQVDDTTILALSVR
jgi:serine phosphatase RsbU (regulator of sigma subunit)